jgi:hypothetical protein
MKKIITLMAVLLGKTTVLPVNYLNSQTIEKVKPYLHQLTNKPQLPCFDTTLTKNLHNQKELENWNLQTNTHKILYIAHAHACIINDEETYPARYYGLATNLDSSTMEYLQILPQQIIWYYLENTKLRYSLTDLASS